MKPITEIDDPRYVKAMSHPLRVRILALLEERAASPVELAGWLGATLGTTAYHVRALQRLGLLELIRDAPVRAHKARGCGSEPAGRGPADPGSITPAQTRGRPSPMPPGPRPRQSPNR